MKSGKTNSNLEFLSHIGIAVCIFGTEL
jgi:hypothetical protein